VGLGIRRDTRQALERLGLSTPTLWQLALAAVMIVAFLALDYFTSSIWHQLWPASYREVRASTERLFARFSAPSGALVMALSAAIGEETLFRGALQPRLRIPLTAGVFALGHVQYGFSPAIIEIFVIGLALSWLRNRANTATCIIVHAGYNFCDALLMPYFP
jgi:membrane protease YdiL (CAAX protease family)